MELFQSIVGTLEHYVWGFGPTINGEAIPILVIALLGTGAFLTVRLGFLQFRRLFHGFAVASGKYDDPEDPGDVSHFQALTTALSATVGIGNIAGVAIAIHFGGPGALFWMWVTALLGMVTKFTEVTLAQHFRSVKKSVAEDKKWVGTVSGGPMYYIERGLGPAWKPLAIFFAGALMLTSFLTGNGVQANTVADSLATEFGIAPWLSGAVTATIVFLVIIGGISRIGAVTAVLAPLMASIYVCGALVVLLIHFEQLLPTLGLIFMEAFNPTAGVAGTGVGALLITMMWGVRRGLFSNEAGQGSAPIAHSAARTDEPVSEGVVALLEPFIDTIVICSMTGLVILATGVWSEKIPTRLDLSSGDISFISRSQSGLFEGGGSPSELRVNEGVPQYQTGDLRFAWHEVEVDRLYTDESHQTPFSGILYPLQQRAVADDGTAYNSLYGPAVENGAPLTALAFSRGLPGTWGNFIVLVSVLLFAVSTAISWSYYGDRCAEYLWGEGAILPYRFVYVVMHFGGAVFPLSTVWTLGDVALGFVTFPNLIALVLLSGLTVRLTRSYFERKAWLAPPLDRSGRPAAGS